MSQTTDELEGILVETATALHGAPAASAFCATTARRLRPPRCQIVPPMRETGLEPVAKGL